MPVERSSDGSLNPIPVPLDEFPRGFFRATADPIQQITEVLIQFGHRATRSNTNGLVRGFVRAKTGVMQLVYCVLRRFHREARGGIATPMLEVSPSVVVPRDPPAHSEIQPAKTFAP